MLGDPELEELYKTLSKLDSKANTVKSVFSFEEDDLNVLFTEKQQNKASNTRAKTEQAALNMPKPQKLDKDYVLDLGKQKYNQSDKDLTLGEYLEKYHKLEKKIESEKKNHLKYQDSEIEKLISLVEDNEKKPINNPFVNPMRSKKPGMFISQRVEENIEIQQNRREERSATIKSKEERRPVTNRIENFSNAKATITNEKFMSPLSLERYKS